MFDKIVCFKALLRASKLTRAGKRFRKSVQEFEFDLNSNVYALHSALIAKTYKVSGYRDFYVSEPKRRLISAINYSDRVVVMSVFKVLYPKVASLLIRDNVACQVGKGTHFGMRRLEKFLRQAYNYSKGSKGAKGSKGSKVQSGLDFYILKADIQRYFYSIHKPTLKHNLYKHINCADTKWLLDEILDSTAGDIGIPLGNVTSQLFAIFYLSKLDRYIKEVLKIKWYNRYMDDFVIIHPCKKHLRQCLDKIKVFLDLHLKLKLNDKTQIFPAKQGVDYLGFRFFVTESGKIYKKLRQKSKQNVKRKVRIFNKLSNKLWLRSEQRSGNSDKLSNKLLSEQRAGNSDKGKQKFYTSKDVALHNLLTEKIRASFAGWLGHARWGNTYRLRRFVIDKVNLKNHPLIPNAKKTNLEKAEKVKRRKRHKNLDFISLRELAGKRDFVSLRHKSWQVRKMLNAKF